MKIFALAASLNTNSVNKKLIDIIGKELNSQGHELDIGNFNDFTLPLFSPDIEKKQDHLDFVGQIVTRINFCDAIIFACPEYNYSISGSFKNFIDWLSRQPNFWRTKKILLVSVSPALAGGVRGLWATRIPLEGCGAYVYPEMYTLGESYKNMDDKGNLVISDLSRLKSSLDGFVEFASKLSK